MKHDEAVSAVLAVRHFLYTYAWRAFACEPDHDFARAIIDGGVQEGCALLAGEHSRLADCQREIASIVGRAEFDLKDAASSYTKLFIGPGKLAAPPWESVYLKGEDLLFQESTLAVREAFRDFGYRATGYPHEADDHLATELGFMAALAKDAFRACKESGDDSLDRLLLGQSRFLESHLNAWLPLYNKRLEGSGEGEPFGVYRAFSRFALELCRVDAEVLEELALGRLSS